MRYCKSRSSQISVEFVTVLGLLLMIFMIAVYVIYLKYTRTNDLKVYVDGLMLVTKIADNINTVNMVGDGYWMFFTIPARLYAFSDYNISFYPGESTVFIKGSTFSKGRTIYFSAPISTKRTECYLKHCNSICNTTGDEACIFVNESIKVRVLRYQGRVFLTEEYNLMHPGLNEMIVPFEGIQNGYLASTSTAESELVSGNSIMYVYRDLNRNRIDFVLKHNVSDVVRLDFYDMMGVVENVLSDDAGEFDLAVEPEGSWDYTAGDMDGGMLVFNSTGFRVCIKPVNVPAAADWVWINSDGSRFVLNSNNDVCITYP
jgi:hypothetical protein